VLRGKLTTYMSVTVSVLASGSRGNCALVATSSTRILVDAGLSGRETFKRLRAIGERPEDITAILITHEHSDHVAGLYRLATKLNVPVFITAPTHRAWKRAASEAMRQAMRGRVVGETGTTPALAIPNLPTQALPMPELPKKEHFSSGLGFCIGDIDVMPFGIPHDAIDPVGFSFRAEGVKIGFATDLGKITENVKYYLKGCAVMVIESNHDIELLRSGSYPWSVKQRIMSRDGHLSNEALAEFLSSDYDGNAEHLVLAHLSEENNHIERARMSAQEALIGRQGLWSKPVLVAKQMEVLEPIRL
jgi:phosphoribosyl 1,2-cyclic phosphodiesterase